MQGNEVGGAATQSLNCIQDSVGMASKRFVELVHYLGQCALDHVHRLCLGPQDLCEVLPLLGTACSICCFKQRSIEAAKGLSTVLSPKRFDMCNPVIIKILIHISQSP